LDSYAPLGAGQAKTGQAKTGHSTINLLHNQSAS
jgi:hypothetical protein